MRSIVRCVAALVVADRGYGARAPATPDDCGDADENGARSVTDGVRVLRTAADLADGCAVASRCDIDGNGKITVSDGVAALRLAAGLGDGRVRAHRGRPSISGSSRSSPAPRVWLLSGPRQGVAPLPEPTTA